MPKGMTAKTGNAQIKKVGHTASNQHGSNPNMKVKGRSQARDLSAK
ncbi:MAG: hypothetical protein KatS3mg015_2938 [Fimbriimonadales bacterium]|nr:MAG: hypothetical protein KatS3mg015_2938 [Fimbriimonadales bacterium]